MAQVNGEQEMWLMNKVVQLCRDVGSENVADPRRFCSNKKLGCRFGFLGILKLRVKKGINLAVRDSRASDPYVVVTMHEQKLRTKVVESECNPEWNDELTLYVKRIDAPIILAVLDKDTFTEDDPMGEAELDIKPLLECVKMNMASTQDLEEGGVLRTVQPSRNNCLSEESLCTWTDGKFRQEMFLRLTKVERGELLVQIEWNDQGCLGLSNLDF
ncbi:protein C2-DOMAIN ABA-RELATED 7-like [Prosopis cineraria]|uniref:protein C2-DOMAIN ABA-RELATED 7-like n=1 Tax=Prosopis cineraria TaxID=364024 RepID=UPI0024109262|nr:protein C2-DOMAIN ABA-RELATED 7-like [Prosopis cineraria]